LVYPLLLDDVANPLDKPGLIVWNEPDVSALLFTQQEHEYFDVTLAVWWGLKVNTASLEPQVIVQLFINSVNYVLTPELKDGPRKYVCGNTLWWNPRV
jgi:hypothetical protein